MKKFKSGFISIIGRPNVGKSTLLNSFIGEKIAIISSKPQTTRNKVTGVYTTDECQIVFTDTPGIHMPKNKLGTFMVNEAYDSCNEVDCIIFVVEPTDVIKESEIKIINNLKKYNCVPVILVINKIDVIEKEDVLKLISLYSAQYEFSDVIPVSAVNKDGIDLIIDAVKKYLPEGPLYYPPEQFTNQTEREIVGEIIREKALRLLQKEIPHGIAVEIDSMDDSEENKVVKIRANIFCEKATHKAIIIGKNGTMLKRIGTNSRHDIEQMLGRKVFLELWVKIKDDWRNNDFLIKNFGYDNKN